MRTVGPDVDRCVLIGAWTGATRSIPLELSHAGILAPVGGAAVVGAVAAFARRDVAV